MVNRNMTGKLFHLKLLSDIANKLGRQIRTKHSAR